MIDLTKPLTQEEAEELKAWLMQWDRNAETPLSDLDDEWSEEEWTSEEDFFSFDDVKDFDIPMTEKETQQLISDLSSQ